MDKRKIFIILFAIVIALLLIYFYKNKSNKTMVFSNAATLSNKTIAWGVKREKDHIQPDLGKNNLELIRKYNGMAIGNKDDKYVYLTFDQGYEAGYTPKILDVLKEKNVKATFFITAHYLNTADDLVKRMIDEENIVGNHTSNHYSMPSIDDNKIKEEIMSLHSAVYEKLGYEMQYMRPPKGECSERTLAITEKLGYKTVMWSLAYDDWDEAKQGREEYGKQKIIENVHPGAIILLHGNSKDNANILGECIDVIRSMGYEFKSLNEFVN